MDFAIVILNLVLQNPFVIVINVDRMYLNESHYFVLQ